MALAVKRTTTTMQLETPRLIIRDWHPTEDVRDTIDIFGDVRVTRWLEKGSQDTSLRQVQGRLHRYVDNTQKSKNGTGSWAVVQKDIARVIGHIALLCLPDLEEVRPDHVIEPFPDGMSVEYFEIGWHFRPASWGFGYATEAARALIEYGFEVLDLPVVFAIAQPENKRSLAVMKRLGMQYDGLTTRCYGGQSLHLYRLSADSYLDISAHSQSK